MGEMVSISNRDELYAALSRARGGETFWLEPGNYGTLTLNGKQGFPNQFDTTVKIASSDVLYPAVFSWMDIHSGRNIAIEGVRFNYTYQPGDPDYVRPFEVNDSHNVIISDSVFIGDLVRAGVAERDGFGHGYGLSVRDSIGVTVKSNEFLDWGRAGVFSQSQDLIVVKNDIHSIRSDGLNFAEVTNVVIEQNHLHDFKADYEAFDHRDMIQFWTNGTDTPSENISIRQNRLDMGEGSYTQSIFMRNEAVDSQEKGERMYYKNLLIEDNTIYNSHLHGITIGETNGLSISGNSLIAVADAGNADHDQTALWIPAINIAPTANDVTVVWNVTSTINGFSGQHDWQVNDNTLLHPDQYGEFFVRSSQSLQSGENHFIALDGVEFAEDYQQFQLDQTSLLADALFHVEKTGQTKNTSVFDATLMEKTFVGTDHQDGTYNWDFGDGATATGIRVSHEFTHAGVHNVTLSVDYPNGTHLAADSTIDIRGGQIFSFDKDRGEFPEHGVGRLQRSEPLASASSAPLQLTGNTAVALVDHRAFEGLRGADAFTIEFSLQGTGTGELFRKHLSFEAEVTKAGTISFQLNNNEGKAAIVTSRGVWVNDGAPHDVSIRLKDGMLKLDIDGVETAVSRFSGILPSDGDWDLSFGNPWGQKANFSGAILAFDMSAGPILPPLFPISATDLNGKADRWDFEGLNVYSASPQDNALADLMEQGLWVSAQKLNPGRASILHNFVRVVHP